MSDRPETAAGGIQEPNGTPGSESSPHSGTPEMSTGDEHTTVTRAMPGESAPPAANQGDAEPVPSAPEESSQASGGEADADTDARAKQAAAAGDSSRASGEPGTGPRKINADAAEGARRSAGAVTADGSPAVAGTGVPAPGGPGNPSGTARTDVPGDSAGVPVPSVHAAAGTSEESVEPDGVRVTSVTAPGKPDGEVDTRA